jgi:hypothetical protein
MKAFSASAFSPSIAIYCLIFHLRADKLLVPCVMSTTSEKPLLSPIHSRWSIIRSIIAAGSLQEASKCNERYLMQFGFSDYPYLSEL